jgi:hypothetical protein
LFLFSAAVKVPKSAAYSTDPIVTDPSLATNAPLAFCGEGSGYVNEFPAHPDISIHAQLKKRRGIIVIFITIAFMGFVVSPVPWKKKSL